MVLERERVFTRSLSCVGEGLSAGALVWPAERRSLVLIGAFDILKEPVSSLKLLPVVARSSFTARAFSLSVNELRAFGF